jgi:hypothetical protein
MGIVAWGAVAEVGRFKRPMPWADAGHKQVTMTRARRGMAGSDAVH